MKMHFVLFGCMILLSCTTSNLMRIPSSLKETPFTVVNKGYSLSGQINEVDNSNIIAIFFHGSGVHDRWETMPAESTLNQQPESFFKPISAELNSRRISTCVFDKRAFKEQNTSKFEVTLKSFNFENIKSDAQVVFDYVNKFGKYEKIILIGHSEGTVTASELAFDNKNNKKIAGVVLIGVLAENLKTSLYRQYTQVIADNAFTSADKNRDGKIYPEEVPEPFKQGLPVAKIDKNNKGYITYQDLMAILKIQVDGLFKAIESAPADALISNKPVQWYRDLFRRKTLLDRSNEYITPVLIVHGELDQNVPFQENAEALKSKLQDLKVDVTLKAYPKYGHALSPESKGLPTLGPIQNDAVLGIVSWISSAIK